MSYRIVNVTGTKRTGKYPTAYMLELGQHKVTLGSKSWKDVPELTTVLQKLIAAGHVYALPLPVADSDFKAFMRALDKKGPKLELVAAESPEEVVVELEEETPKANVKLAEVLAEPKTRKKKA